MADSVEFLSFYGLDYPLAYGRGYGEFKLIDHAIANSKLIGAGRFDDVVWKVTGRYIIENIVKIVRSRPFDADIYSHKRNYPYRVCELYLLAWNTGATGRDEAYPAEFLPTKGYRVHGIERRSSSFNTWRREP